MEEHYVPRRCQRTTSILTFFAQDLGTHKIAYATPTCSRQTLHQEVIAFCDHWHQVKGEDPKLLVLDSKAFHIDALSSAVPLNVDLDVIISLAGATCNSLRQRAATPLQTHSNSDS